MPNVSTSYGCLARKLPFWFYVCGEAVLQRHAKHNNLAAYYFLYYHFMHASSANICCAYIQFLVFMCHIMHMYANCDPNVVTSHGCFARKLPFWFNVCCEAVHQRHAKHNNLAYYFLMACWQDWGTDWHYKGHWSGASCSSGCWTAWSGWQDWEEGGGGKGEGDDQRSWQSNCWYKKKEELGQDMALEGTTDEPADPVACR